MLFLYLHSLRIYNSLVSLYDNCIKDTIIVINYEILYPSYHRYKAYKSFQVLFFL